MPDPSKPSSDKSSGGQWSSQSKSGTGKQQQQDALTRSSTSGSSGMGSSTTGQSGTGSSSVGSSGMGSSTTGSSGTGSSTGHSGTGSSGTGYSGTGSSSSGYSGTGSPSTGSGAGSSYGSGSATGSNRTGQTLSDAAGQAGDKVASTIDSQKNRAADGLGSFAQALRQTGNQMRGQTQGAPVDQYVASAAGQIERFSGYLRSTNTKEIVRNVEDFARQQPALFIGGAFMLGLLGARFLKSSAQADTSRGDWRREHEDWRGV